MANGGNLQSQDQKLNNETSNEEVKNNENVQEGKDPGNPEEIPNESASETKEEQLSSVVSEEVNEEPAPPEESNASEDRQSDKESPQAQDVTEEKQTESSDVISDDIQSANTEESVTEETISSADEKENVVSEESPKDESTSVSNDSSEVKSDDTSDTSKSEESKSDDTIKDDADKDAEKKANQKKAQDNQKFNELFEELKQKKNDGEAINVKVLKKIRGGLRVVHQGMPMFLPSSHFNIRKSSADDKLYQHIGQEIDVHIHELSEEIETKRKTVIVSRRKIAEDEFWNNIKAGQEVKGTVSSIASFGVFLDLGGYEGLIHISRLSQAHIDHPRTVCKKGDKLTAVVVDVNRAKERIALSRKELEDSPWENIEDDFPKGTVCKGKIKRITDFGAYVELREGVDGLLRTNEISWTERVRKPSDVLSVGQEIEVEVISANASKKTAALSYKRTQPNPWNELKEKYPIGTEIKGVVKQIVAQGAVFTVDENIDGFMPKSKMKDTDRGSKIPYAVGEEVDLKIADLVPEKESLIFSPIIDESQMKEFKSREPRRRSPGGPPQGGRPRQTSSQSDEGAFTFMDLLSDQEKSDLSKVNK